MLVSVIICAYTSSRFRDLEEAVMSLYRQTYDDIEVIVVIDEDRELYELVKSNMDVRVVFNERRLGLPGSRNRGIEIAEGEIIAFFDDDAVADRRWIEELVRMYEEFNAISAGGRILPMWMGKKPDFLPEEFYWLIGATYLGFPDEVREVRNTFTSNLSFRADVIRRLGGFRSELVERGGIPMQSEETEVCERMRMTFGRGVMYNPNAIVYHKVYPDKLRFSYLLRRSFWQGYSKAIMRKTVNRLDEERRYLMFIVRRMIKRLLRGLSGSVEDLKKFGSIAAFTAAVGIGYVYGTLFGEV